MKYLLIKYLILPLFLMLCVTVSEAESSDRHVALNSVYIQALGKAGYGSVNYERLFFAGNSISFGLRAGLGTYNLRDFRNRFNPDLIMPFSIVAFYGTPHAIELTAGKTFSSIVQVRQGIWEPVRENRWSATMGIGYRYMQQEGGFLFRLAYKPVFEFYDRLVHWGGISIGYSF